EIKRFGFGLDKNDKWLNAQNASTKAGTTGTVGIEEPKWPIPDEVLRGKLAVPTQDRLYYARYALKMGWTIEQVHELTKYDPWFIGQMKELVEFEGAPEEAAIHWSYRQTKPDVFASVIRSAKEHGYSDVQLAAIWNRPVSEVRAARIASGVMPVYKLVDTCAAEFEAATPYYYSTYESPFQEPEPEAANLFAHQASKSSKSESVSKLTASGKSSGSQLTTHHSQLSSEDEIRLTDKPKVIIIGGGPNRIGQGIEFDYCCVHAAFAMRELGFESVMINSNPETVSTDYDTSDLLFFEPLTHEDVLNICERLNGGPFEVGSRQSAVGAEKPADRRPPTADLVKGVIVQLGGQTPLNLARGLHEAGVPLLGTSIDSLDRAGDREQFRELLQQLGLKQPPNGIARNVQDAKRIAREIGYPVLVRPSFVLGGRAMEIVDDDAQLNMYMREAIDASTLSDTPILIDKFLDNADECDLDCLADYDENGNGRAIVIGVMEHIEEAGIHSGDSACVLPPYTFSADLVKRLKDHTYKLARALKVCGLMNVQFAVKDNEIYVIEVNPRASRTVPFVGKATGMPWAKIAAKVMAGKTLDELGIKEPADPKHISVKEVVFPFSKFPGVDVVLGPEMRSTGEVMGIDKTFALAFAQSQLAAGTNLPMKGTVFISARIEDRAKVVAIAQKLSSLGFNIVASSGTAAVLKQANVKASIVPILTEGRPNLIDKIKNKEIAMIINTPTKRGPASTEGKIRSAAVMNRVPIFTTLTAASAATEAIEVLQKSDWKVRPLQSYHPS
ncbi:MAG TPA: carbamoyl-phosphate synthase large subunit, partial [Tepidisphaeraceae bacterium]|nr:carbamoyl-phosphate synthase large subunit [Tepidisphaeraceae bacterium]